MQRALGLVRGLLDAGLLGAQLYWMLMFGALGLWNVGATPGWSGVYIAGLGLHLLLLRKPTRTRASLEAWAVAGLLSIEVILSMARAGAPFSIPRIGGWNSVLDGGEVNWVLWPYVHLLLWWPAWQVTRAIPWSGAERREGGVGA